MKRFKKLDLKMNLTFDFDLNLTNKIGQILPSKITLLNEQSGTCLEFIT